MHVCPNMDAWYKPNGVLLVKTLLHSVISGEKLHRGPFKSTDYPVIHKRKKERLEESAKIKHPGLQPLLLSVVFFHITFVLLHVQRYKQQILTVSDHVSCNFFYCKSWIGWSRFKSPYWEKQSLQSESGDQVDTSNRPCGCYCAQRGSFPLSCRDVHYTEEHMTTQQMIHSGRTAVTVELWSGFVSSKV